MFIYKVFVDSVFLSKKQFLVCMWACVWFVDVNGLGIAFGSAELE